jgi:hypothetical protein
MVARSSGSTTTMRTRHYSATRLGVAAALLVGSVGIAQAHTSVAVGLNFGVGIGYPYGGYAAPMGPVGGVAVGWGARGYYPYHGWRGYPYGGWRAGWGYPGFVVAAPIVTAPLVYGAPVYNAPPPVAAEAPPAVAQAPTRHDPVIYPREGQDAQQTEYDRQKCNRWATTQPSAVADATVFLRAVEACMDAHGYTMK